MYQPKTAIARIKADLASGVIDSLTSQEIAVKYGLSYAGVAQMMRELLEEQYSADGKVLLRMSRMAAGKPYRQYVWSMH